MIPPCITVDKPLVNSIPGLVGQSVARTTADPVVMSLIPACFHTFMEIDHEMFLRLFSIFLLIQEGLLSVTSKSISRANES